MQPVSATEVRLLQSAALTVTAGLELLKADLSVVRDISDNLQGGRVERSMAADIHGTCQLELDVALVWGVDLVRPYMVLSDLLGSVRHNLGVFALTTPANKAGLSPATYVVAGYDRLYLLARQVGRTYTALAGTTYRQALLDVFAAAGLTGVRVEGSAADSTLPVTRTWALVSKTTDPDQTTSPVTWLRIVNDLLRAVAFRAVWCDEAGVFRCDAYAPPLTRAIEYTFDADDGRTLLAEDRTVTSDLWATPNRWVFLWSNRAAGAPDPTEGDGIYTVDNRADGPTSQAARGLVWPETYSYEAASQAALVVLGNRRVSADKAPTASYAVATVPFPAAGHADVFSYADLALGGPVKVQAARWSLPLDGADMTWTWEVVA